MIWQIIEFEGGYVNNPNDPGGETKYGIAKRYHPDVDIYNLTKEQAYDIYYKKYYSRISSIKHEGIRFVCLDSIVSGQLITIKQLQTLLSMQFSDLKPDGIIGPRTILAINQSSEAFLTNCIHLMSTLTFHAATELQRRYQTARMKSGLPYTDYTNGWKNRMDKRLAHALSLSHGTRSVF